MELILREDFKALWEGKDPFAEVDAINGDVYRELEGRRTLRFVQNGKVFFLKSHKGIGWNEIIKNWLQIKKPILGAANEKDAISALSKANVGTMTLAAFGERGNNPARQESFIITDAIEPSISLEDLAIEWRSKPPSLKFKRLLYKNVCDMTRDMHASGVNHRDFYICHFLLLQPFSDNQFELKIIDLHRALIHKNLPRRWRLKDLASLYYSAFDVGLTRSDKFRFIRHYTGKSLRQVFVDESSFWKDVEKKAVKLYDKAIRKGIVR